MNATALIETVRETATGLRYRFGELHPLHAAAFSLLVVGNLLVVGTGVASRLLAPNDTRHWLLRARYYAGWEMPAADVPGQFATHPVAVLTLAAVLALVGSALLAAKLWTVLVYLFATTAVYVTVREFASARVALVALATVSFAQYLYLDLVTWGGLPNLLAAGLLTLSVGALLRARRTETVGDRLGYGVLLALTLFAHPPSAPVVVAVLGTTGVALALARRDEGVVAETLVDSLLPSAVFLGYVALQWEIFSTYAASTSPQDLRTIWLMLSRHPWMLLLFVAAVTGLPVLVARLHVGTGANADADGGPVGVGGDSRAEGGLGSDAGHAGDARLSPYARAVVVLGWAVGPLLVAVGVDVLPGVETELSRVSYYLAAPLSATVGLYVVHLAELAAGALARRGTVVSAPGVSLRGVCTLVLAVAVVAPGWAITGEFYSDARAFYTYDEERSIYEVARWIDARDDFDGRVAGPYAVVPWVKALAGEEGMTPTPRDGSYRPDEWREAEAYRQIAAVAEDGSRWRLGLAAEVMAEYEVRYLVVANDATAANYAPFGPVVHRTPAYLVIDVDPAVREGVWTPPPPGVRAEGDRTAGASPAY